MWHRCRQYVQVTLTVLKLLSTFIYVTLFSDAYNPARF